MKRILFFVVMALLSITTNAQSVVSVEGGKYPVYCDMMGYSAWGVGKVKVILDMGHKVSDYESLYDDNGKKIKFNTMMEAVNYMAKRGWKVDRTYNISEVGLTKQAVIHYLLVKYVTDDKEIDDGLKLQVKD